MIFDNRIKNRQAVLVGHGNVRVAKAVTHIATTAKALTKANSIGYVAKIELTVPKDVKVKKTVISKYPIDIISEVNDLFLECTPNEVNSSNIPMAIGQDTITGATGDLVGSFGFGGVNEEWWRVEVGIDYPLLTKAVSIVLPKMKVISDFSIPFILEKALEHNITFQASDASFGTVCNSAWISNPLGTWTFVTS